MIKILYIITQGEMGGAQRYVFDLATNLDRNKYHISVVMGEEKPDLKMFLERQGITVNIAKYLKRNINPLSDILAVLELKKIIREFNPDIVHLNSSKAGVLGSLAAWLAGNKNVVFTAHGFAFLEPHMFKSIYFWAEKFASYFRKKIITVSEHDRTEAIASKLSEPEKFITIHNGIAHDSPPPEEGQGEVIGNSVTTTPSSSPSRGGEKAVVIGTIAHDYPTKDLKTLRQAFQILKLEYPNLELKIISGVSDAAKLLSTFDIYVCSSIKEGFPYTILEAMRAGLPIVSTNVGGIPEAITDGREGLLVPPKNPEALAGAIKKLLTNPALAARLGSNAKQKSLQFNLARMIEQTEKIYQSIT